jgi:hypothetical protein
MFNDGLPKARATYDARQLAGLDYIMWSCKQRGIMLLLTLGNLWNAYKGPEDFLAMATGTAGKHLCYSLLLASGASLPCQVFAVYFIVVVWCMACASWLGWTTSCGLASSAASCCC